MTDAPLDVTQAIDVLAGDMTRWTRHPYLRPDDVNRPPINPQVRQMIYSRDGFRCRWCGTNDTLEVDHIIPWSAGGGTLTSNLQTLCHACNTLKSNYAIPGQKPVLGIVYCCVRCSRLDAAPDADRVWCVTCRRPSQLGWGDVIDASLPYEQRDPKDRPPLPDTCPPGCVRGWIDAPPETVERNGVTVTYDRVIPCPQCRPSQHTRVVENTVVRRPAGAR